MPEGPLGGPRPLSSHKIKINFLVDGKEPSHREIADIENKMRRTVVDEVDRLFSEPPQIDLSITERSKGGDEFVVTAKTRQGELTFEEMDIIRKTGEKEMNTFSGTVE